MATLTVSTTHDYSFEVLSNIDVITFTGAAIATFASSQFVAGSISPNVAITGNAATNGLVIRASGIFTMAGWTFSSWALTDTITVTGGAGGDTMTGSNQADIFFAGDGVDTLVGGDGNDILVAHRDDGPAHEGLFATDADNLSGGIGNDTLYGDGFDTLSGGDGFDVLQVINGYNVTLDLVAAGIEYVVSEFGNDTYNAASATSTVEVYGSGGNDIITGGTGNDNLWGGVHNDTLTGNDGDDLLVGDLGADSLSGGIGNDRLYIDPSDTFIDGGDGFDAAYIATGGGINLNMAAAHLEWVADFAGGNDTIDASGVNVHVQIYGAGGDDTITGSSFSLSGSGFDFLWGEGGNDTIRGNNGYNIMVGGTGADTLIGSDDATAADVLYGTSGSGGDGALDTFVFINNWNDDYVFDFEIGIDKFDFTSVTGVHAFSDLTVDSHFGNAVIKFQGNEIVVVGKAGQITANDFLFNAFTIIAPDAANTSRVGDSVSAAGDINGDGFADVIVGAPNAGGGSGAVYIVYGHAHGDVDLSFPGANVTVLTASGESGFGTEVANVGDFNGDGFGDLLILNDDNPLNAYVLLGRSGGFGSSLDVAADPQVYQIQVDNPGGGSHFHELTTTACDVNGDGFDDVLLTVEDPNFSTYLIYGSALSGGATTVSARSFSDWTQIVGDVNGDGLTDLAYLSRKGNEGTNIGEIRIVYGSADTSEVTLVNTAYMFTIGIGLANLTDLKGAGDFNGDGLDDIVIGLKPAGTFPAPADFVATIVFSGNPSDPLDHVTRVRAETDLDNSGVGIQPYHANGIGDVNGDGYGDIALTRSGANDVYVVLGSANPASIISLENVAAGIGGAKIYIGELPSSFFDMAPAGDVNNDGIDDFIVGDPNEQAGAFVYFGSSDWHL